MEAFKKNLVHRIKDAVKRFFRFDLLPRAQWRRLMIATLALALVTAATQVYLFYRVEAHTIFQTAPAAATPAPVVNEAKLTTVLEKFENKALVRSSAVQLVPTVADPSR